MADELVTLAQVKAQLKLADTNDDTYLTDLIDGVSDWVQEYTGRKFVAEPGATYVTDTAAGGEIVVARGIRAVTSLSIASANQPDDGSGTYAAVALSDVHLRPLPIDRKPGWPATLILITGSTATGRLSDAIAGAKIVGDFGFAAVPPAIQRVTIDAVVSAYQARRAGGSGQVGADNTATYPWSQYFAWGSPQRQALMRYRVGQAGPAGGIG